MEYSQVAELLNVKKGDVFTWQGYQYRAVSDAALKGETVYIRSDYRKTGTNAGWYCADIMEWM